MVKTIKLNDGEYTIIYDENNQCPVKCLRYGQDWKDLTGDNLIFYLCNKITELTEKLADKELEIEDLEEENDYISSELSYYYDKFGNITV